MWFLWLLLGQQELRTALPVLLCSVLIQRLSYLHLSNNTKCGSIQLLDEQIDQLRRPGLCSVIDCKQLAYCVISPLYHIQKSHRFQSLSLSCYSPGAV